MLGSKRKQTKSDKINKKAIKEEDILTMVITDNYLGAEAFSAQTSFGDGLWGLRRERAPFAVSRLLLCEGGGACGALELYYTPLGVLICAELGGMGDAGIYTLRLEREGGDKDRATLLELPPLYVKNGSARRSAISSRIFPRDLVETFAVLGGGDGEILARGRFGDAFERRRRA